MKAPAAIIKVKKHLHIWDGVFSAVIVLFATYMTQNLDGNKSFLGILFLLLAAENGLRFAESKREKRKRFCVVALYLVGAALILLVDSFHTGLLVALVTEVIVILLNRVMAITKKSKKRVIAFNVVCILLVVILAVILLGTYFILYSVSQMPADETQMEPNLAEAAEKAKDLETIAMEANIDGAEILVYLYLMLMILWQMILHVVGISISQMKLNILLNIIRETYVLEILMGLVLMIIACSSIFTTMEPNMAEYWDALWYSFALVTTIGFGDITATTMIGRALSVFLGIYGIVVVAIITSVIVNFYGELRRMTGQKTDGEKEAEDEGK